MAAAAGSAPAPVGFKGRRAPVTPRRSENGRRPRGRTVRLLRVMQACSLAHSPTKSRRMDLHHRCPGGGAFTARCIATLPRLGKWICHGDVRPAVPDTNGVRRSLRFGRAKWCRRRGGNARLRSSCRLIPSPFLSPPGRLREWGSCRSCTDLTRLMMPLPLLLGQGTGKCGPPRMCAGFSRLRVGCIAAYACGPKGAGGATCTRTPRRARSFEVRVYADSTTPAGNGAEGETCTPKAHWLSTRSVC